ncbi:MAG TPA: protein kinase [Gemmatimonadaceae bacterium]|nr:protein kinase [Gemmatimonadaceae bacterium]
MSDGELRQPSGDFGSLLADRWQQLSPLVDAVLDAQPGQRSSVLLEVSAGDPALRAEVERLVDECERGVPMLDRPAAEGFSQLLVEDVDAAIPDILGGRYRIEREVGRGGMARVYLARDLKHSRSVAVKVIRPDLARSLGRDRFLREIEIAARLRHPNIVPVYDSGDADGVLYFVMPFEEGPSIRERLRVGAPMSPGECVSVLRDVARALAYAHEHGVVHRDVKPDNVMLSSGAAVVTDFGIAKAIAAASAGDETLRMGSDSISIVRTQADSLRTITQVGVGIGTPAYMAPEQAAGDPSTDHRADIYSFGCLAYELFAGHPPFHDLAMAEVVAAHIGTAPVPLSNLSDAVPESVSRLVAQCLEKKPAARPQSAQELLTELDAAQTTGPNAAIRRRRRLPRTVLGTSVIVGLALIGYVVTRDRTPFSAMAARPVRAVNPEARRLYDLGQRGLTLRGQKLQAAVEQFRSATQLDTLYADAFGGLSLALALSPYFENISTRQVAGPVRSAAERALRLDSTLAPPHVALGLVHQYAYHWDSAATEFETAVRLRKADDIEPLVQYGRYMLHEGRAAGALKQFLAARDAEPASALVSSWLAFTYMLQGQMDSAGAESERALQNDSTNYTALQHGASIRVERGDFPGARALVNRLTSPYDRAGLWVLAVTGDTATALGRLRQLESERPTPWLAATTRAYVMMGVGDTTEAMAALERATDANEIWHVSGSPLLDHIFDPVRSSARFQALLRRVNLPASAP